MTINTVILVDDAEKTITQVTDTTKPKDVTTTTVWKPGSAMFNYQGLLNKAQNARANNSAFLALASPTQAQAITQVQALTRQVNALILIMLDNFTDVSDT